MKTSRGILGTLAQAVALTMLPLAASAQTSIFHLVPTPNQYPINNTLYASSASSPNDIWAVGNTTIHFDGRRWKVFPAAGATDNSTDYLRGVLDFSPTLAWAGGGGDDQGQIIDQWNGQEWERLQGLPFPPEWLPYVYTLSGTSPNDIWVTGSIDVDGSFQLFFEHWDGQSWGNIGYLPGGVGILYGASQDTPNDAWAVGNQIISYNTYRLVMHYEGGTTWYNLNVPFPPGASGLYGILALTPNNVWAVGWQNPSGNLEFFTNLPLIYHFDGTNWTIVPSPGKPGTTLIGIVANSANDMYAFGFYTGPNEYGSYTLLFHWDGHVWKGIPSPNPKNDPNYIYNQLLAGVVPSPGNVWIFGQQWTSPPSHCTDCTLAMHTATGASP